MDVSNWYSQGFALASQAVEADNAKDYKKAFDLYSRSLDHIIAGLKCALVGSLDREGITRRWPRSSFLSLRPFSPPAPPHSLPLQSIKRILVRRSSRTGRLAT